MISDIFDTTTTTSGPGNDLNAEAKLYAGISLTGLPLSEAASSGNSAFEELATPGLLGQPSQIPNTRHQAAFFADTTAVSTTAAPTTAPPTDPTSLGPSLTDLYSQGQQGSQDYLGTGSSPFACNSPFGPLAQPTVLYGQSGNVSQDGLQPTGPAAAWQTPPMGLMYGASQPGYGTYYGPRGGPYGRLGGGMQPHFATNNSLLTVKVPMVPYRGTANGLGPDKPVAPLVLPFHHKNDNSIIPQSVSSHGVSSAMAHYTSEDLQRSKDLFILKASELDFDNITVVELKNFLKDFGLAPGGKKDDLISRIKQIKEYLVNESTGGLSQAPTENPFVMYGSAANVYFANNTSII